MTHRLRTAIFLISTALLTGCANNTDMPDVSDIQESEQNEQIAYQESSYHVPFRNGSLIYEVWDADTEPYAVITGVTDGFRDKWRAEFKIPEELGKAPVKEIGPDAFANRLSAG